MFFLNIYRNFCVPAFILDKGLVGYKVKFYRMEFCVIAGNFYSLLSHSVEEINQVLAQCVLEKAVSIWIFHWNVLLFVLWVICCSTLENVRIFTPARLFCPKQRLYIFGNFRAFGFFWDMCHLASFDIWDTFCPIFYNLQTRKNDIIKQFFFDCCRSRLCGTFIFHTLIGAYKNWRLTKFYHDHTIFVCFTDLNRFAGFSLQNLLLWSHHI